MRGLILTTSASLAVHRDLIITLAARYKLPAVYSFRFYASGGGLISYGTNFLDELRRAAGYIDDIRSPATCRCKYELVVNLKTAKVLGFNLPATLLAGADEVIE
jgi:putative tryptophan/tyrosine transport system substrate-binding protein